MVMVRALDNDVFLAKCDMGSAFWFLLVHPDGFNIWGFTFEGGFYFNKAAPVMAPLPTL